MKMLMNFSLITPVLARSGPDGLQDNRLSLDQEYSKC